MDILIKPLVTEKMTAQTEKLNRYGFIVNRHADKEQIKTAIERMYEVNVVAVNTLVSGGKMKYRYTSGARLSMAR